MLYCYRKTDKNGYLNLVTNYLSFEYQFPLYFHMLWQIKNSLPPFNNQYLQSKDNLSIN